MNGTIRQKPATLRLAVSPSRQLTADFHPRQRQITICHAPDRQALVLSEDVGLGDLDDFLQGTAADLTRADLRWTLHLAATANALLEACAEDFAARGAFDPATLDLAVSPRDLRASRR
jgi:hypothetical protein